MRVAALGRKGRITTLMKGLGALAPDDRRRVGTTLNDLKNGLAAAIAARQADLAADETDARLLAERLDVTLPARPQAEGRVHPISQTVDEVVALFAEMGFSVAEGPDIEDDWYNFTALNIPPEHPARQEHDTFYLPGVKDGHRMLLRTHTSPVQIRAMQETEPPIRIIVPGRTYRCDSDVTHTPMFHQVEGLVVDETTHFGHLKGCLIEFCRAYFGLDDLPVRFRPSYFPFTEPSAEVDIGCTRSGGALRIGHGDDWLEILGCGMVNPRVLGKLRARRGPLPGLRLRHGAGADRHAEVRDPGPPHLLRVRPALASPLRLRRAGRSHRGAHLVKFTLGWLKEHLATDASAQAIAETLTKIGLEVEDLIDRAKGLEGFTVARVVEARPHPDADRLKVCVVDTGAGTVEVVCGAPNARTGLMGVFAPAGAFLPGLGSTFKKARIRGVTSDGMLLSEREMGLGEDHAGIVELAADVLVGAPAARAMGLDDPVFDVAITPNRGDCLGVRGIARDLAAAGLGTLQPLIPEPVPASFESPIAVHLDFDAATADACPYFVGRYLSGVENGESPAWLGERLIAVGLRPVSALVDVTNLLTIGLGRPAPRLRRRHDQG